VSQLSPDERQTLQAMLRFRDDPPSLAGWVAANWRQYLTLFGVFALVGTGIGAAAYFVWGEVILIGCVVGGVFIGTLLRDLSFMNAVGTSWTVRREVIDWQKVRQLLGEDDWRKGRLR
jgi:hypothetical protein